MINELVRYAWEDLFEFNTALRANNESPEIFFLFAISDVRYIRELVYNEFLSNHLLYPMYLLNYNERITGTVQSGYSW